MVNPYQTPQTTSETREQVSPGRVLRRIPKVILGLQVAVALFQSGGLYWFDTNSGKYASPFATGGSDPPAIVTWGAVTIWLPFIAQALLCFVMGMVFADIRRRARQTTDRASLTGDTTPALSPVSWGFAAAGMLVVTSGLSMMGVIFYGAWFD